MDLPGEVARSVLNEVFLLIIPIEFRLHINFVSRSKPRQIPPSSGRQLPSANTHSSTTVQQRLSSRAKRWICRNKLHTAYQIKFADYKKLNKNYYLPKVSIKNLLVAATPCRSLLCREDNFHQQMLFPKQLFNSSCLPECSDGSAGRSCPQRIK